MTTPASHQCIIRICAGATLILALANLPLSLFGAMMAPMNGLDFFAMIAAMVVLVLVGAGLSVWALGKPRWWAVVVAGSCSLPSTSVDVWGLVTPT